jgi:hypothetical protein
MNDKLFEQIEQAKLYKTLVILNEVKDPLLLQSLQKAPS